MVGALLLGTLDNQMEKNLENGMATWIILRQRALGRGPIQLHGFMWVADVPGVMTKE